MSSKPFPDELALKVLRIFPEFGVKGDAHLWKLSGACVSVEDVGGTPELARRFEEWTCRWEETTSANNYQTDRITLALEQFDKKGLALATELKGVVGDNSKVIYELVLTDGAVEVLADGSLCDWPLGVNLEANRKWAKGQT